MFETSNNINNANANSYKSGGVHHRWGGKLKNCIVAYNTARGQPEPTSGTSSWTAGDNLYINCCGYPAVPRFTEANGCIAADPKFVDPANGDFRLAAGSPCINKGVDANWMSEKKSKDLAGHPRIYDGTVDIGCYEWWLPPGLRILIR